MADADLPDQCADDRGADEEGAIAERHHDREHPPPAYVARDRVDLRSDHADSEADQRPAHQQDRERLAHDRHEVADGCHQPAEANDVRATECRDRSIAEHPDQDHERADRHQPQRPCRWFHRRHIGDVDG